MAIYRILLAALFVMAVMGCGSDGGDGGKECDDGETFEYQGVTYVCENGEWPKSGKGGGDCESDPGAGVLSTETLEHDGETREYLLYLPASYDGAAELPLVLNFHGYGGTAEGHMCAADMRSLADTESFILVYPQGTLLDGVSHWNQALPSPDNKSDADDLGFVDALISALSSDYSIDLERVYACGYSNGGFMSYGLACHLSEKIAAVGGVSGTMQDIEGCSPSHTTAVIIIHGTDDGVVPYDGGIGLSSVADTIDYWVDYNSTSATPEKETWDDDGTIIEHYSYIDGDGNATVQHYKVIGGDHVWFDFEYNGSHTNQLLWDFFSHRNINGAR